MRPPTEERGLTMEDVAAVVAGGLPAGPRRRPLGAEDASGAVERGRPGIESLGRRTGLVADVPPISLLTERNVRTGFFEDAEYPAVLAGLPAHCGPWSRSST